MQNNLAKAKKQATHEFFPRTRGDKKESFIFNKAPINKNEAYQETRQKVISEREEQSSRPKNAPTFMSKLYQDDDEFDELKIQGILDEDDDEVQDARNNAAGIAKRKEKMLSKMDKPTRVREKKAKIGKLALKKGTIGMFAICEIGKDYLIVNHTRNSKGYIQLKGTPWKSEHFRLGQLVIAVVSYEIGGAESGQIYNYKSGRAGLNRKVQLSLDISQVNKMLSAEKVTKNMVLQAQVDSKEAKGYLLNFGFKDQTRGFLKFNESDQFRQGELVTVVVKSVMASSKVIKCELLSQSNSSDCVQQFQ